MSHAEVYNPCSVSPITVATYNGNDRAHWFPFAFYTIAPGATEIVRAGPGDHLQIRLQTRVGYESRSFFVQNGASCPRPEDEAAWEEELPAHAFVHNQSNRHIVVDSYASNDTSHELRHARFIIEPSKTMRVEAPHGPTVQIRLADNGPFKHLGRWQIHEITQKEVDEWLPGTEYSHAITFHNHSSRLVTVSFWEVDNDDRYNFADRCFNDLDVPVGESRVLIASQIKPRVNFSGGPQAPPVRDMTSMKYTASGGADNNTPSLPPTGVKVACGSEVFFGPAPHSSL